MPREPKKLDNRTPGETIPRQFRITDQTIADLDAIGAWLTETTGVPHSRTDALRYSARQTAKKIPGKKQKTA